MKKCQEWLEKNHPEMYQRIWSQGSYPPRRPLSPNSTHRLRQPADTTSSPFHRSPRSSNVLPLPRGPEAGRKGREEEGGQGRGSREEGGRQDRPQHSHHQAHRAQQAQVRHCRIRARGLRPGPEEGRQGLRQEVRDRLLRHQGAERGRRDRGAGRCERRD